MVETRNHLEALAGTLERMPRQAIFHRDNWTVDVPAVPGVYALWDRSGAMVYVGETSSLLHRMRDLGRSVNHTCRRKLTARHNLTGASEEQISAVMAEHYVLSFVPVDLGRAELEEYLSLRHRRTLLNSPGRRLLHGHQYSWVAQA